MSNFKHQFFWLLILCIVSSLNLSAVDYEAPRYTTFALISSKSIPPFPFSRHYLPPVFSTAFLRCGHQNCTFNLQPNLQYNLALQHWNTNAVTFIRLLLHMHISCSSRASQLQPALWLVISKLFSQRILYSCLSSFCSSANGCTVSSSTLYHAKHSNKWLR